MIETAQNVADRYGLTREEIDAFALRSQHHAAAARDSGRLAKEIMPVPIPATKTTPARVFEHDEFIRDDTTAERLAALPVQSGTTQMTAGNSSPLTDGASAIVIASGEKAAELGIASVGQGGVVGGLCTRSADYGTRAGVGDSIGAQARRTHSRPSRRVGSARGI